MRIRKIRTILLLMMVLVGCSHSKESHVQQISASKAKEMMNHQEVIVADVRSNEEYQEGHIEGAINIANEEIEDMAPEKLVDKEATILVYCRTGNRSQQAASKLVKMGYIKVYDFGGIDTWPDTLVQ